MGTGLSLCRAIVHRIVVKLSVPRPEILRRVCRHLAGDPLLLGRWHYKAGALNWRAADPGKYLVMDALSEMTTAD